MKRHADALIVAATIIATGLMLNHQPPAIAEPVVIYKVQVSAMKAVNVKAIARELLTTKSFGCFERLINLESRFNAKAQNPNSSASGIGQLLDSTYRNIGMRKTSEPQGQLIATLAYIARHYGGTDGPCLALTHELKHHNY